MQKKAVFAPFLQKGNKTGIEKMSVAIPSTLRELFPTLPAEMEAEDLASIMPDLVQSVGAFVENSQREVMKTESVIQAVFTEIPNGEFVRDEYLGPPSEDRPDPNSVLDGVLPVRVEA